MKPKARVKITLECNKRCKYCINNCTEYQKKWKIIDQIRSDQRWNKFRSIIISGGEPTINIQHLKICAKDLRIYAGRQPMIYLQTNGYALSKMLVKALDDYIDGIGYSIHTPKEFKHIHTRLKDINKIKPVRVYVQDTMEHRISSIDLHDFDVRLWKDGEFDSKEQIYVIQ